MAVKKKARQAPDASTLPMDQRVDMRRDERRIADDKYLAGRERKIDAIFQVVRTPAKP